MKIESAFQYERRELLQLTRIARRRWWLSQYILSAVFAGLSLIPAVPMELRILFYGIAVGTAVVTEPLLRRFARVATAGEGNAPRIFEITQDAFVTIQGAVTRSISWAEMYSVRRRGEWWQLNLTEKQFILFPARALTANQRSEFEAFLASKGWAPTTPAS